jgi:hypothetical protein
MYQKPNGAPRDYQVKNVTITLFVTLGGGLGKSPGAFFVLPEPMYIEFEGGYNISVLMNPIGTQWHEVYPDFCPQYKLTDFTNVTGDNMLDSPDIITLENKSTNVSANWTVEDVAVDMAVTIEPPAVGGEAYPVNKISVLAPWIALGVVLAGGSTWYVLRRRRARS